MKDDPIIGGCYRYSTHNDCGELPDWLELQGDLARAKHGEDSGTGTPIDAAGVNNAAAFKGNRELKDVNRWLETWNTFFQEIENAE